MKFTQEYEVYSQRFQKEDFGEDEPFDPKVLPNEYLTAPKPSHTFVYVSTIQRMARNLFGAEGCFAQSGNTFKVAFMLRALGVPYETVFVDYLGGGTRAAPWRATPGRSQAAQT